jgi:ApbE superfamily uncharacterized protein (UPF0280 family)
MQEDFEFKDTILKVKCDKDIGDLVKQFIIEKRQELENHISLNPEFQSSFEPLEENGPEIARIMARASKKAGIGPMSAVAGTVSELLVRAVKDKVEWVIVENGGDICIYGDHEFAISIFAGDSPLSNKIGISLNPKDIYGICTSSASVGHSISLGKADSVTVFSNSTPLADSFATAIANKVDEIQEGLDFAKDYLDEIDGVLIIKGKNIGKIGKIPELLKLS